MSPDLALLMCVMAGTVSGLGAQTRVGAILRSTIVYLLLRFAFHVAGVIPNYSGGWTFSGQWFAELLGQCIVVAITVLLVRIPFRRKPRSSEPNKVQTP